VSTERNRRHRSDGEWKKSGEALDGAGAISVSQSVETLYEISEIRYKRFKGKRANSGADVNAEE
jgi:hypothetical protein